MRDPLDKFYTTIENSQYCLNTLNLEDYDLIVEPSAGNGSFSNRIKNCVAYDIAPEDNKILKQDFLSIDSDSFRMKHEKKKLLFVGNPPFGRRSMIAKKFIQKCIELGATTIAFILPDTFKKYTNQKIFGEEWRLVIQDDLPETFFDFQEEKIHIPCSWFVWTKDKGINPNKDLRKFPPKPTNDFKFLSRGDLDADYTINGNNGKVKDLSEVTNSKAEHYIYVNDRSKVKETREIMSNFSYDFVSSVNGGVAWINKNDIIEKWNEQKNILL